MNCNFKTSFILSLAVLFQFTLIAQNGYEIKLKIDGFDQEQVHLGYFYGDKNT